MLLDVQRPAASRWCLMESPGDLLLDAEVEARCRTKHTSRKRIRIEKMLKKKLSEGFKKLTGKLNARSCRGVYRIGKHQQTSLIS